MSLHPDPSTWAFNLTDGQLNAVLRAVHLGKNAVVLAALTQESVEETNPAIGDSSTPFKWTSRSGIESAVAVHRPRVTGVQHKAADDRGRQGP
jgi:hypothetical protein